MNAVKWFLTSKTLWFNMAYGVGTMLQAFAGMPFIPQEYAAPALVIGNLLLRFVTNQGVSLARPS